MSTTRAIARLDAIVLSKTKVIGSGLARNIRHHLASISEQVEGLEAEIPELKKRHAATVRDLKAKHKKAVANLKATHVKEMHEAETVLAKAQAETQAGKVKPPIDPLTAEIEEIYRHHQEVAEALARYPKKMKG